MMNQCCVISISCDFFPLLRCESIWIWNNTYSPQVQAIRIKAGVNCGITRFVLYGMKTACFFQQPDLLIGNILQICIPQRINPYCRPLTMIKVLPIIHTARVMKVGKQSHYKRINTWC